MYEVGDIAHYKDSYDHWHQSKIKHVGTNMLGEPLYGLEDGFWLLENRIAFCERKEPEPSIIKEIPDDIIKNLAVNGLKRILPDFEQLYMDNIDNDKLWDNLHCKCELKGTVETNVSAYLYIAQAISLLEGLVIK